MKPNKKDFLKKEVYSINKELQLIWKQQQNLGYSKLEKPIRHGWFKELEITPNVERYKNEKAIIEIYNKLEKKHWGSSKDKATEKWQNQVSEYLIYKELPTLSKKQFNKLSDKAQKLCVPYQFKNKNKKIRTRFYVKFPKATYKIRFKRAYITHRKRIDPKLEKRQAFLENKLKRQGYYEENEKEYGYKCLWSLKPKESRNQVKQKLKQQKLVRLL
jgi:hypothetical protein